MLLINHSLHFENLLPPENHLWNEPFFPLLQIRELERGRGDRHAHGSIVTFQDKWDEKQQILARGIQFCQAQITSVIQEPIITNSYLFGCHFLTLYSKIDSWIPCTSQNQRRSRLLSRWSSANPRDREQRGPCTVHFLHCTQSRATAFLP